MIEIVKQELRNLESEFREKAREMQGVMITLEPKESFCPQCFGEMQIQKSRRTYPVTIKYGAPVMRIVTLVCKSGCINPDGSLVTRSPDALARLVPRGSNNGYDVEVFVGLERYFYFRQREEIKSKLEFEHGISISAGEVSNLSHRFLEHLELLHNSRSNELKKVLRRDGGYPLNVDATGENGCGTLLVAHAGWRGWVLGSWRLTTECADQIIPCLEEIARKFGAPCTVMRDLGRALIPAVKSFVEGQDEDIKILSCHQHFLKDVGKDLLTPSYDELRKLLSNYGLISSLRTLVREWGKGLGTKAKEARGDIQKWAEEADKHKIPAGTIGLAILRSLAQWTLDYSAENQNLRFPFERPYLDFYQRCKTIKRALDTYLHCPPNDPYVLRSLKRFTNVIDPVISDTNCYRVTKKLSSIGHLFDELRKTLRLDPRVTIQKQENIVKTEQQKASELNDIEESLKQFRIFLQKRRLNRGTDQDMRKAIDIILDHIEKHDESLWGHVIHLPIYSGGGIRVVDRTNICTEGFFNYLKHGERRRSGRKILSQDMEYLPPASALVSNLKHSDYVEIICGSLDKLPEAFAKLDMQKHNDNINQVSKTQNVDKEDEIIETASLSKSDRNFVRNTFLNKIIIAAASSQAQ